MDSKKNLTLDTITSADLNDLPSMGKKEMDFLSVGEGDYRTINVNGHTVLVYEDREGNITRSEEFPYVLSEEHYSPEDMGD